MRYRIILLSTSFLLAMSPAPAADHVWIVGGGPALGSSQAQIELNVNWVIQVLHGSPGARQLHVHYTDGNALGKDVVLWQPPKESRETLQPLARVFSEANANGESYYSHQIPYVVGGTEASVLKPGLEKEFSALKPGDRALLIYNGHGLQDSRDAAGNTLRLWNNTSLSVRELDQIMNRIDPSVPVRFVFTQCFSGGFERLVHPRAQDTLELGEASRCGFFAESADREAEGCSASIKIGDYRDYSTFFFAALQGHMRTGELIEVDPDRNGDGMVSLHEAHLFALAQGQNADLPRSTSEVFLERWQPWYLRWVDTGAEPDNVYGKIAREVARKNGLPEAGLILVHEMRGRRQALAKAMDSLQDEQDSLDKEIDALRSTIKKDVAARWPEALAPYTLNFSNFLKKDLAAAQDFILVHPRYAELVTKQDRRAALDEEVLHVDRDITQLDKILRLRTLARLQSQFARHATAKEREWYGRLMSCEGQGL
jgi:hypothetical protein